MDSGSMFQKGDCGRRGSWQQAVKTVCSSGCGAAFTACVWDCSRLFVDETARESLKRLCFVMRHQF